MPTYGLNNYIDWFSRQSYPSLFDAEVQRRLENVRATFGNRQTEEVILEVHLSDDSKRCGELLLKVESGEISVAQLENGELSEEMLEQVAGGVASYNLITDRRGW